MSMCLRGMHHFLVMIRLTDKKECRYYILNTIRMTCGKKSHHGSYILKDSINCIVNLKVRFLIYYIYMYMYTLHSYT